MWACCVSCSSSRVCHLATQSQRPTDHCHLGRHRSHVDAGGEPQHLKSILTCLTSLTVGSSKRILARGPVSGPHPLGPTRTSVPVPLASAEAHERRRSGSRRRGCGDDGNEANEENSSQAKRALRTPPMPSFPAWVTEP
jgi:hypothetical protein